jgi:acyl carrier protein
MRRHQYLGAESPLLGTFRLREDLGLDSLDVVEFIVDLEAAYRITIPDEEVNQLTTIYLIEACVRRQLQASPPPPA